MNDLLKLIKPFVDGLKYDPGHSDLDDEQPITIRCTLGDWRAARRMVAFFERMNKQDAP